VTASGASRRVAAWHPDGRTELTLPRAGDACRCAPGLPLRTPPARRLHWHTTTGRDARGDRPANLRRQTTARAVLVGSQAPLRSTASQTTASAQSDQHNANLANQNSVGIHATCSALLRGRMINLPRKSAWLDALQSPALWRTSPQTHLSQTK
jgi:hypothetical protein